MDKIPSDIFTWCDGIFISDIWPIGWKSSWQLRHVATGVTATSNCWEELTEQGCRRHKSRDCCLAGKRISQTFSFCQCPPPKKKHKFLRIIFQLYASLCLFCPRFIHLPPIFLSPLQGPISPEGGGTISSPWVDNPLSAHLQGIRQATLLPTNSVVAASSA